MAVTIAQQPPPVAAIAALQMNLIHVKRHYFRLQKGSPWRRLCMSEQDLVRHQLDGPICVVTINRPAARNAVNPATARALADAFRRFDADDTLRVAILTGADGTFCAGFD
jgi:1,4-dihydroxy-2-naphthoyl-CoA synthase